jgi:hypothetical protein
MKLKQRILQAKKDREKILMEEQKAEERKQESRERKAKKKVVKIKARLWDTIEREIRLGRTSIMVFSYDRNDDDKNKVVVNELIMENLQDWLTEEDIEYDMGYGGDERTSVMELYIKTHKVN